ncbi:hypothetical protein FZC79_07570 [Rossellomorea vietnamensis]|uniref:Uncharacterized protein n=1 Tax=Rossellomorea vietnamensis TaxID=218284 RepID=A0A5D4KIC3_9BACI|nr:DUF5693 family protein [Rossellomorea vietnamensis]TYR76003.1 hypothetical protein FZC79_07570 [Rossellomorea vietnamensis]
MKINPRWFWIITLLAVIISIPWTYERWNTEVSNDNYEIIIPYHQIMELTQHGEEDTYSIDEVLSSLKSSGLATVSMEPGSIDKWEEQGFFNVYTKRQIEELIFFNNLDEDLLFEDEGIYISVPEDPFYIAKIQEIFDTVDIAIGERNLIFVHQDKDEGSVRYAPLGFNQSAIEQVKNHDLNYILRLKNSEPNINEVTFNEFLQVYDKDRPLVLFDGKQTIGHSEDSEDTTELVNYSQRLADNDINSLFIEGYQQDGFDELSSHLDYDVIRLHSINVNKTSKDEDEIVSQAIRAVKERNHKVIFYNMANTDPQEPNGKFVEPAESLKEATDFITDVRAQMPDLYSYGPPEPFEYFSPPLWLTVCVLLGSAAFAFLAVRSFANVKISITALAVIAVLALLYIFTNRLILLQAAALLIAVLTPIFAVLAPEKNSTDKIGKLTLTYLKSIGISIIGILLVVGLLNGSEFILGLEMFRAVILVYIIPIAVITLYILVKVIKDSKLPKEIKFSISLDKPVLYGHLLFFVIFIGILVIVALVGDYYLDRSGNSGTASTLEISIRQKLEELLFVRPRTKEFLIGFPLYILGLYLIGAKKTWGIILLIPGTIGFLSIMNTFNHFHIPLYISTLRTVYSIILGYLIGLFLIYLYKKRKPILRFILSLLKRIVKLIYSTAKRWT